MSAYPPPTETVSIYNPENFPTTTVDPELLALFVPKSGGTFTGQIEFSLGLSSSSQVQIPDGSVSAPALAFDDELDTGLYRVATDTIGITTGGVSRMQVSPTQVSISNDLVFTQSKTTITGACAGASTDSITINLVKIGGIVYLDVPLFSWATGAATFLALPNIPAGFRPVANRYWTTRVVKDNVPVLGTAKVDTFGNFLFDADLNEGGFGSSNSVGQTVFVWVS